MGQPTHLEEDSLTDSIKLSNKIAPKAFCLCCSPYRNLFLVDPIENELFRDLSLIKGPHLGSISPALSCNSSPDPTLVSALIPAPTLTPVPINELFKQFMKVYWKLNQELE